MKNLSLMLLALPLVGGALVGCGSSEPPAVTKDQEAEIRHPSHVPPAGYKPDTRGGGGPPPTAATPPTAPTGG